jgi:mercuric ion binding protein
MKIIITYISCILLLVACGGEKNAATVSFKVYGNCGMCEKTIEGSLEHEGIYLADWDKETKMIQIRYDSVKIQLAQLHQIIADSGYDTELARATDEAYSDLHECCQYERPM